MSDERIVELPYTYTVRGLLRGRRLAVDIPVLDFIQVKVRNVDAAVAPVAFTARDPGRPHDGCVFRAFDGRPIEAGKLPVFLYVQSDPDYMTAGRAIEKLSPDGLDELARLLRLHPMVTWQGYPLRFEPLRSGLQAREIQNIAVRSIECSDREERRAEAAAALDGLVFVDDVAHFSVKEPRWAVSHEDGDGYAVTAHGRISLRRGDPNQGEFSFRADRLDDARRMAAKVLGEGRAPVVVDVVEDLGLIEWRSDQLLASATSLFAYISDKAGSSQFKEMPDASILAFLEMRRLARQPGGMQSRDLDEFYLQVKRFKDGLESEPEERRQPKARFLLDRISLDEWRRTDIRNDRDLPALDDEAALEEAVGARP